jgi:hypothetical protein
MSGKALFDPERSQRSKVQIFRPKNRDFISVMQPMRVAQVDDWVVAFLKVDCPEKFNDTGTVSLVNFVCNSQLCSNSSGAGDNNASEKTKERIAGENCHREPQCNDMAERTAGKAAPAYSEHPGGRKENPRLQQTTGFHDSPADPTIATKLRNHVAGRIVELSHYRTGNFSRNADFGMSRTRLDRLRSIQPGARGLQC